MAAIRYSKIIRELELKTFILYVLRGFGGTVQAELIDALAQDYVESWFDYVVARGELDERGIISHDDEENWSLTQLGRDTLEQVESSLPLATRLHLNEDIERSAARARRERYISATFDRVEHGTRVSLLVEGDTGTMLDMTLLLPSDDLARRAVQRFRDSAEKIYTNIAEMLAGE